MIKAIRELAQACNTCIQNLLLMLAAIFFNIDAPYQVRLSTCCMKIFLHHITHFVSVQDCRRFIHEHFSDAAKTSISIILIPSFFG